MVACGTSCPTSAVRSCRRAPSSPTPTWRPLPAPPAEPACSPACTRITTAPTRPTGRCSIRARPSPPSCRRPATTPSPSGKYVNLFDRVADKLPPGWDEFHGYGGGYYDYNLYSNGVARRYGSAPRDYSTDVIRRITAKALDRAPRDEPLFAWITPFAMHKPWTVAPRDRDATSCNPKAWKPPGYMEKNVRDKPAYVRERADQVSRRLRPASDLPRPAGGRRPASERWCASWTSSAGWTTRCSS